MADNAIVDKLKFYREEVKHEFNLIAQRLSWYVTCQSFLLTAFAIAKGNTREGNWFTEFLLPVLGIVLSILAYLPIRYAVDAMEKWLDKQNLLLKNNIADLNDFQIDRPGHIHWVSMWFPQILPFVFLIAWVAILIKTNLS